MVENKHLKNIGLHNKTPTSDANLEKRPKNDDDKTRRRKETRILSATMSNK